MLAALSAPPCPQQEFSRHVGLKVAVGCDFVAFSCARFGVVDRSKPILFTVAKGGQHSVYTIDSGHTVHSSNV